jgi:hypothetical protein
MAAWLYLERVKRRMKKAVLGALGGKDNVAGAQLVGIKHVVLASLQSPSFKPFDQG